MKNEGTKTGIVGFFDILGYKNLLERNEPETIAEEVLPILTNIGKKVTKAVKKLYQQHTMPGLPDAIKERLNKIIKAMSWLVFSDTVLLALPIYETNPMLIHMSWLTFLLAVIHLQSDLFSAGLPTRGAIDHGKFFIKNTCFAGRTIVNAYQLCSQIELAACVFSEGAANEFRRAETPIKKNHSLYDTFVVEYLVPMKSDEKHLLTVMAHTYDIDSPDIHSEVMRAFWGNKKDIPLSARQKAQNTEQWLEFLEYRLKIEAKK